MRVPPSIPIKTSDDGTYFPDPTGEWAVILPVRDRNNELCDLVAWLLDDPGRWWLRHGDETPILGCRRLAVAAYFGDAIKLYSTPERWLVARGHGAVILKWDVDCRDLFDGVARVECDCPTLATKFRQTLRRWEPKITSAQETHLAA